ncbi:6127_t:CDS:1, partial [Cetraspora pellucida]
METPTCTGCEQKKPLSKFTKSSGNLYRSCKNCCDKAARSYTPERKQPRIEENEDHKNLDALEIIDPDDLCIYIIYSMERYSQQDSLTNMPLFSFECYVNISTIEKSLKEIAE